MGAADTEFHGPAGGGAELEWRDAHLIDAPLTDVVVEAARKLIKDRGGNGVVSRRNVAREIITAITELTTAPTDEEWRAKLIRAAVRHDQAQIDYAEAEAARELVDEQATVVRPLRQRTAAAGDTDATGDAEPLVIDYDAPFPDYDAEAQ